MKGTILAGGLGTRLGPLTKSVNKHLLPIFNKPMIFYPMATLMTAGIREILIITNPKDVLSFKNLLGDGSHLGVNLKYGVQESPRGIVEGLLLSREFAADDNLALILGDNFFHGKGLGRKLSLFTQPHGAIIFAYEVSNPADYGVVQLNSAGNPVELYEKPNFKFSNFAIPGLYFFNNMAIDYAQKIEPSVRNELEIVDLLKVYLKEELLKVVPLPRGTTWIDCGTTRNLNDASNFVRLIEERQGNQIACLEEIAWRTGFIDDNGITALISKSQNESMISYLCKVFEGQFLDD